MKIIREELDSIKNFFNIKYSGSKELQIIWLGQAGFAFRYKGKLILVDPYLSDYLAKKYERTLFPHIRLMKIPIHAKDVKNIDYILCSHPHSDHMDPETLTPISKNNPNCNFIVPSAEIQEAISRGIAKEQITPINAGQTLKIDENIIIQAIPAAHETFKINKKKEHSFLGFILNFNGIKLYHSGDCIPYDGLVDKLKRLMIDIALLPINGRDDFRLKNGIAGNFKIKEVLELCKQAEIKHLIVHHFGMFAYNTVTEEDLKDLKRQDSPSLNIIIPQINYNYRIIQE